MKFGYLTVLMATSALAMTATPASAQEAQGDIVVTARKKDETLISVPVVVSAVSKDQLESRAISNLDGIARIVPQLIIGDQGGSVQGGNVAIRGISGPDSNPFGDQAVSFNVDGVQIAKASVRRLTNTDVEQIEVLKGPQALYFGKNSPAGIVTIRTADPKDHFQAKIQSGYEFNADEWRTEGYVSGPITDTLGARIAAVYSKQKGWLDDVTPTNSPVYNDSRNIQSKDYAVRGTLKWEPTTTFDARLKVNFSKSDNNGPAGATQFVSCPYGARQTGSGSPCGTSNKNVNAGYGPVVSTIPGTLNHFRADGENFSDSKQSMAGLEMNWRPTDYLSLTSVTGYYDTDLEQCQNYENDFVIILPSCNVLSQTEFSQEFRASTDLEGPINFTGGAFFGDTEASTGSITYLFGVGFDLLGPGFGGLASPALVNNYFLKQDGSAWSFYGNFLIDITKNLELDVGARYSHEKKTLKELRDGGGITQPGAPVFTPVLDDTTIVAVADNNQTWNDLSPEVTLSYRPSETLTLFGSYKEGFLSGGYNSSSVEFRTPGLRLDYDQQTVEGEEIGLKTALLDKKLFLNLAAYTYKVKDLQVVNFTNASSFIRNAATVKIKGFEGDFNWITDLTGLSLHGSASYNDGEYSSFPNAPCYNGQSIANGCNSIVNGAPVQNLSGTELIRAPKISAALGFTYDAPIGPNFMISLSGDATHNDDMLTDASSAPQSRSPEYTMYDASIRFSDVADTWELALIGRNLTNEYFWVASPNAPFTGSASPEITGLPGSGTTLGDRFGTVNRGREIMLRAAYKFGG